MIKRRTLYRWLIALPLGATAAMAVLAIMYPPLRELFSPVAAMCLLVTVINVVVFGDEAFPHV